MQGFNFHYIHDLNLTLNSRLRGFYGDVQNGILIVSYLQIGVNLKYRKTGTNLQNFNSAKILRYTVSVSFKVMGEVHQDFKTKSK